MLKKFAAGIAGIAIIFTSSSAWAGSIILDRSAFEAAIAGLPAPGLILDVSDDFEGPAPGPVPPVLPILGGAADFVSFGSGAEEIGIVTNTLLPGSPSTQAYIDPFGLEASIFGSGGPLGFGAFGFDIGSVGGTVPPALDVLFHHLGGTDAEFLPLGTMGELTSFVGWIGAPGEILDFIDLTTSDVPSWGAIDNIVAYSVPTVTPPPMPMPEPAALGLLGLGLLGLGMARRRRKPTA